LKRIQTFNFVQERCFNDQCNTTKKDKIMKEGQKKQRFPKNEELLKP